MRGFRARLRVAVTVILTLWIGIAALYNLLKPISNGCVMTYIYPTYIPVSSMEGASSAKYGLYLYHEGWRKIDFKERLKQLNGVPVLFIPGNGGSYKQVIRVLRDNPLLVTTLAAITLVRFVHPALGLFILILSHGLGCHSSLCSSLTASFRSHAWRKQSFDCKTDGSDQSKHLAHTRERRLKENLPVEENSSSSPDSTKSYGDIQLEIIHHRHGLLILHHLAALMFVPSLMAWLQRIGVGHSFPRFLDSVLCVGVILHGTLISKPEFNSLVWFPNIMGHELRLNFIYVLAGYYSFLSGLALAPCKAFYAIAALGAISFAWRIIKGRNGFGSRKHSHRQ